MFLTNKETLYNFIFKKANIRYTKINKQDTLKKYNFQEKYSVIKYN